MRYIIYGAGAIGGSIGGLLHAGGFETALICRGAQLDAVRENGLEVLTPRGSFVADIPASGSVHELSLAPDDVILLTMKSQDTERALHELEAAGAGDLPVICCQNGVDNERIASRRFSRVYAMLVAMGADYLQPGRVTCFGSPAAGVLDCGSYPRGIDSFIEGVAADLSAAGLSSRAIPDVIRFKYRKLITNLNNALSVLTSSARSDPDYRSISSAMRLEAEACIAAAGIDCASHEEYNDQIWSRYKHVDVPGASRGGTSTWQSLMRGQTSIEVDYLNGEIALLGAQHGVPAPCNAMVRKLTQQLAFRGEPIGHYSASELATLLNVELAAPVTSEPA
jgi:2-dehydropantoate 2-reductase